MEGSVKSSLPDVAGFYTQPYNELVRPERVWVVSKYFLRRWVPYYLGPTRFWLVVAARHLAYLHGGGRKDFSAHDAQVFAEASCSRRTYYRAKAEMDDGSNPLALFVRHEETQYRSRGGKACPMPTVYHVRLDDVLTPGDAIHLASWMQAQKVERKPEAVVALLTHMLTMSETELLAPSLRPFADDSPAVFKALTVTDVLQRVFGSRVAADSNVQKMGDALHTHLTGTMYIGRQYFRQHWVNELGPGPAYLLAYLRSYCFIDDGENVLRNEFTTTRPELADAIGVDRATLFRWLKKIEENTPGDQPFAPFLEELDSRRVGGNDVEVSWKVQLREPLTAKSLAQYHSLLADRESPLQIGTHKEREESKPPLQNGTHEEGEGSKPPLQNGTHRNGQNPAGMLQNGTHDPGTVAKWHSQRGAALQNGTAGVAKWHSFKHYKHLLVQILKEERNNTFAAASAAFPDLVPYWKLEDQRALRPLLEAAVGDLDGFCDEVGIYGLAPREAVINSGLSLEQVAAWYLYTLTQPKLGSEQIPGYVINRVKEAPAGVRPPAEFERLATMSWEQWRCYACLLLLPTDFMESYQHDPLFITWVKHYGRSRPEALPFGVGIGVAEFVRHLPAELPVERPGRKESSKPEDVHISAEEASVWKAALGELSMQMTKATFNTWLKDSHLRLEGDRATVLVRNEFAAQWINGRLQDTVTRTLNAVSGRELQVTAKVSGVRVVV